MLCVKYYQLLKAYRSGNNRPWKLRGKHLSSIAPVTSSLLSLWKLQQLCGWGRPYPSESNVSRQTWPTGKAPTVPQRLVAVDSKPRVKRNTRSKGRRHNNHLEGHEKAQSRGRWGTNQPSNYNATQPYEVPLTIGRWRIWWDRPAHNHHPQRILSQ
jgi:hypothetical protein